MLNLFGCYDRGKDRVSEIEQLNASHMQMFPHIQFNKVHRPVET